MTNTTPAIALLAAMIFPGSSAPDIVAPPPPGMKRVTVDTRIRLAEPDGPWIVGHSIVDGDTFAGLAQRHLGSEGRVGWLANLNSAADPRRLEVDQIVWLPRPGAIGAADARVVYIDQTRSLHVSASPFVPREDGTVAASTLLLVAQPRLREFERCLTADSRAAFSALRADGAVTRLSVDGAPEKFVPSGSPVARIEVDASLRLDRDGAPVVQADAVRYLDADGEAVDAPSPSASRSWHAVPLEPSSRWWQLGLLAGAAGSALLFVAVRRARSSAGS